MSKKGTLITLIGADSRRGIRQTKRPPGRSVSRRYARSPARSMRNAHRKSG